MKAYITLCFYDFPNMICRISTWENVMRGTDRLLHKQAYGHDKTVYIIKRGILDVEGVVCVPINDKSSFALDSTVNIQSAIKTVSGELADDVQYLKTLIFGKASLQDIIAIKKMMVYFDAIS